MKLQNGDKAYSVQGYIDRLTWDPAQETYEIHDYKTGDSIPTQQDADEDRQLALYQLGVMQRWPDARNFKLVWHYLTADKELVSTRTSTHLESLEREVVEVIHQIEQEAALGRWDVRTSALCGWCEYKTICPAWKHPTAMLALAPNEYLQDTGVQLVQKYAALEERKADLQVEIKKIESEQHNIDEA